MYIVNFKNIILFLTILLTSTYANNTTTESTISEYEEKAFYHEHITKEYELALGYHKIACELGAGYACANVGNIYWHGHIGHKRNKKKTVEYNLKGCELGNAYACRAVAISYSEGWLAKPDNIKALHYCHKAYKLGSTKTCKLLGLPNPD